jgi:ATP-binding cassette subfamily B protein
VAGLAPVDILRGLPGLGALAEDDRARVAALGTITTVRPGTVILATGQRVAALHVILSGRVRLVNDAGTGAPVPLDLLSEGAAIGEGALWADETSDFSARALTEVTLFTLARADFARLQDEQPGLAATLRRFRAESAIRSFIAGSTVFSALTSEQLDLLVRSLARRSVAAGETLIREGDEAAELYLVESGRFRVTQDRDPSTVLATVERGALLGEIALQTGGRRTATVVAETAASVFVLSRELFLRLLHQQKRFAASIDELVCARTGAPVTDNAAPAAAPAPRPGITPADGESEVVWHEPALPDVRSWLARLRPFPAVRQQSVMDCGAACITTVCRYYGKHVSLNRMRELSRVEQAGASMRDLAIALQALGFEVVAMLATLDQLGRTRLPAIANWRGFHWVVVYRVTNRTVTMADPGEGLRTVPTADFLAGWTRYTLYLQPTERFRAVVEEKPALGQFFAYLRPFRRFLLEIGLAALATQLLNLLLPVFTRFVIDQVVAKHDPRWLWTALAAMAVVTALSLLVSVFRQRLLVFVSLKVNLLLARDFYTHLLSLPLPFFEKRKVGDVVTRFGEGAVINRFFTHTGVDLPIDILTAVLYLSLMTYYNVPLTLVAVGFLALAILNVRLLTPYLQQGYREVFQRTVEVHSHVVESLTGLRTIKTLAIEPYVRGTWEHHFARLSNAFFATLRYGMISGLVAQSISHASSVAILFYGATLVLDHELSLGTLVAFTTMTQGLHGPAGRLVSAWSEFQKALMSVERLNDVLEVAPEQPASPPDGKTVLRRLRGHVRFEHVTFRYHEDGKNVLQDISLDVQPGQRIGLVGRSGSGKSTLVKLLLGFYPASSGAIHVDGFSIGDLWLPSLRRQIGVVPQESFLFRGTVRENIAQAKPGASANEVIEAARRAAAHDFISSLPHGYDTMVAERGANLSGGQRQRVAIARAVLQDPRMLILDEATSALDNEAERQFLQSLESVFADRTVFMIAHRLSTVRRADRILVLDRGLIAEQGNHEELMARRGLYYFLASQQLSL